MTVQHALPKVDELNNIAAQTLELAKKMGATQAEVSLSAESGFDVHVREGDVDTLEHTCEKSLHLTVYLNQQSGSVSTSDFSIQAIKVALDKACNIAKYTGSDPYSGLADPKGFAINFPDLELYHPWDITPSQAIDLTVQCEADARAVDQRIRTEGVNCSTHNVVGVYANSLGFMGSSKASEHSINCGLIAMDGVKMQRAHEYTLARKAEHLDSVKVLAQTTATKVLKQLGARKISTRQCPVVYSASLARGLLSHFVRAISGSNLYRESSFLLNHLDQKVFPEFIHLYQRPHLRGGWGSANFDSEGVKTEDRDYVKEGILTNYILGSYSARKLGMETTGNASGVYNLFINHSELTLDQLLAKMGTGLFVTELMGQGVNLLTGDYSRGAFGYWVENGVIQYPVEEITIAGNLKDIFANIIAVANDVDRRGNIQTGAILIDQMTVAGS